MNTLIFLSAWECHRVFLADVCWLKPRSSKVLSEDQKISTFFFSFLVIFLFLAFKSKPPSLTYIAEVYLYIGTCKTLLHSYFAICNLIITLLTAHVSTWIPFFCLFVCFSVKTYAYSMLEKSFLVLSDIISSYCDSNISYFGQRHTLTCHLS